MATAAFCPPLCHWGSIARSVDCEGGEPSHLLHHQNSMAIQFPIDIIPDYVDGMDENGYLQAPENISSWNEIWCCFPSSELMPHRPVAVRPLRLPAV